MPLFLVSATLALGCRVQPANGGDVESATEPVIRAGAAFPCAPEILWRDDDGDGFGGGTPQERCAGAIGYVPRAGDCDDTDPSAFPGAPEVCGDGRFQDCDRATVCRYDTEASVDRAALVMNSRAELIVMGHGDFDGDGLEDVAAGSMGEDLDEGGNLPGAVYIYKGSRKTGTVEPQDVDAALDEVAFAGWLGDVTGDRRDDLLVPSSRWVEHAAVLSWPFQRDVSATDQAVALLPTLLNPVPGWHGVGDVDGDGVNDVVECDYYYNDGGDTTAGPDDGAAFLFLGPLYGELTLDDAATVFRGHDGQYFGYGGNRIADVDGDGQAEVEVSAARGPGGTDAGEVFVFSDPPRGTVSADDADARLFGLDPDGVIAGKDATGGNDVDGDGYGDLLVGAVGRPTSRIGAWLVRGPLPEGERALDDVAWATFVTSNGSDGYGGVATALPGDMDGDGYQEVVLGWDWACRPDGSSCPGVTSIFYGPVLEGSHDWRDAEGLVWGSGNGADQAGHLHAIGDFDGDGLADVALGGALPWGPPQAYVLLGAAP